MNRVSAFRHLPWLAVALIGVAALVWREVDRRDSDAGVTPAMAPPAVSGPEAVLSTAGLALAFGFEPAAALASSQLDLRLQACFVSSRGASRALLASASGEASYQIGDRLPGNALLRRIDSQSVTVWLDGREQVLRLSASVPVLLKTAGSSLPTATDTPSSSRHLRKVP